MTIEYEQILEEASCSYGFFYLVYQVGTNLFAIREYSLDKQTPLKGELFFDKEIATKKFRQIVRNL